MVSMLPIALTFLLFLPLFVLYSFHLGYRRLLQEQSFSQLKQFGKLVWWISLHRLANTLMLLAVTFAVVTGRMMKEEWLPSGEIHHQWYLAHLVAWLCVFASLAYNHKVKQKALSMLKTTWLARINSKLSFGPMTDPQPPPCFLRFGTMCSG